MSLNPCRQLRMCSVFHVIPDLCHRGSLVLFGLLVFFGYGRFPEQAVGYYHAYAGGLTRADR